MTGALWRGWDISSAQNITDLTGGYFTGLSYADAALGRIDSRSRFSYLLGYTPSDAGFDGQYRNVKVVVNRPGTTVLFQHGYYAVAELQPLERREALTSARLASAGGFDEALKGITLDVKASRAIAVGDRHELPVDLTIDPSRLSLTATAGRRVGAVDIQIFCGDAKQNLVGDLKQRVDLNVDEETYQRVLTDRIHVRARAPVIATVKYVKVVVYDYGADLLGSFFLTIK